MNRQRRGFLITFSGFDGAGKTTQVKLLSNYLSSKGKKVLITEEMFGYFLLKPFIRILRFTTGSLPGGPVRINKTLLPKFWFIPAFVDIWLGFIFKIRSMLVKYDFVLADRFYTDIWANLLYYGYIPDWAFKFFIKLLPKPDIAIMFLVKPEVVLQREREFPISYYKSQAKIYNRLANEIDFSIINASQTSNQVFNKVKNLLNKKSRIDLFRISNYNR